MKQIGAIVYDKKNNSYTPPVFFNTPVDAKRWFTALIRRNIDSPMNMFPEDFELYSCCEFDTIDGSFTANYIQTMLMTGDSVKNN